MILLVLAIFCLAGAVFLIGDLVTLPARQRSISVRRAATYGRMEVPSGTPQEGIRERLIAPIGQWLAKWALRVNPRSTTDTVERRLMSAGVGLKISPTGFLAIKGLFALLGFSVGAMIGSSRGLGGILMVSLVAGAIGFFGPDYAITLKARSRKEKVKADLPDALDLLAVSVEAGLGFDAAVARLCERIEGPLAEELRLTLQEMRIGETRENALKKLAARTDVPAVSSFVRAMIQADQMGMSIGRILRTQATDSRLKRQAAAEERAMKAPVKMLVPTVLFIFPAMFLVVLGPAFMDLFKLF